MSPAAFNTIATLVRARSGIVLGEDKGYMLDTRLSGILRENRLSGLDALAAKLQGVGAEPLARAVTEALTTNESSFFRDGKPFDHLRGVLPKLAAARSPGQRLRIWSAACSTGQEAYSVAMILSDLAAQLGGRPAEILGTDLSREVVARAQEGVFTQFEVQRGLPIQMLVKHFRQDGTRWQISPALRAMVRFEQGNLLDNHAGRGSFDVIFCRNVLIYFDAPTKRRVLEALADRLLPDGVLYLGGAETVLGITERLVPVTGERGPHVLRGRQGAAG
ncbi:CheR family methyltransferase [Roseomonas elaeocarpi]|uniref:protein-glutamate O-methyltransferase n=1 Tax=Roseomonas elaeocarpi TaxID=907779 RepID=A0ABV6JTI2_9PROT